MKYSKSIPLIVCFTLFIVLGSHNSEAKSKKLAKAFLQQFVIPGADLVKLNNGLRPALKDYKKYFTADVFMKAKNAYEKVWKPGMTVVKPKSGQTQILIWKATTKELKTRKGNANFFPGGYKKASRYLRPGHTVYRFKFVKKGEKYGMAYDGLVFIDGRWVIFPKPWKFVR